MPNNKDIYEFMSKLRNSGRIMTGLSRMEKLKNIFMKYASSNGSFVECGVAMGGCLALMKYVADQKKIFGFDSFEGMPNQTIEDGGVGNKYIGYKCSGDNGEKSVSETFDIMNLSMQNILLIKGWFNETLSKNKHLVGDISVLRVDGDWYESVKCCLDVLYSSVIIGGTIIIDDYDTFPGCKKAVNEFRTNNKITSKIEFFEGNSEICWIKEV